MHKVLTVMLILLSPISHANQTQCLAKAIYHEARGEPEKCQRMVADVVLNRVEHKNYPSTVCDVVFQTNQFSWSKHPRSVNDRKSWKKSLEIAKHKMVTKNKQTTAIYFTQGKKFGPVVARCGKHIFMGTI